MDEQPGHHSRRPGHCQSCTGPQKQSDRPPFAWPPGAGMWGSRGSLWIPCFTPRTPTLVARASFDCAPSGRYAQDAPLGRAMSATLGFAASSPNLLTCFLPGAILSASGNSAVPPGPDSKPLIVPGPHFSQRKDAPDEETCASHPPCHNSHPGNRHPAGFRSPRRPAVLPGQHRRDGAGRRARRDDHCRPAPSSRRLRTRTRSPGGRRRAARQQAVDRPRV